MKLHYGPLSPFVRKVRVMAIETGLDSRIELIDTHPFDSEEELARANPIGRVPTLVADNGTVVIESDVICEYLDTLHGGTRMFPPAGAARWTALKRQALADGILDASVLRRYESLRPAEKQWPEWDERQRRKVVRALDQLEAEAADLDGPLDIGRIAVACALGYLDFRFAAESWRDVRPALARWYAGFAERPSMKATIPVDPVTA